MTAFLAKTDDDLNSRGATTPAGKLLDGIIDASDDAIFSHDLEGNITSWNPGATAIFGYRAQEIVGKSIELLTPPERVGEPQRHLEKIKTGGRFKQFETVRQRKDGQSIQVSATISPIRDETGQIIGVAQIVRDISSRKKVEERMAEMAHSLAEKNKDLETMVYVASHDLRSPLVNIQGFTEELRHACDRLSALRKEGALNSHQPEIEKLIEQDMKEAMNFVIAGVEKIDLLLSGILRFSRLGRAALKIQRVDVASLVADITRTIEFQIKKAGVSLTVGPLPPCQADAVQLNQVFSNLLDNALKYLSPQRPGKIHISAMKEKGRVIYAVKDNGIGIAPEHLDAIFEIFHRVNPHATAGEGLGLAIAQKILHRQNGVISVQSTLDEGSTFFVSLPAP